MPTPKYKIGDHIRIKQGYWGVIKEVEIINNETLYSVDVDGFHGYQVLSEDYIKQTRNNPICECGANSVRELADADAHAHYCPRYTKGIK